MISRFAKALLAVILMICVIGTLFSIGPITARDYANSWSEDLLGQHGIGRIYNGGKSSVKEDFHQGAEGGVIMDKLGNATAKAELGRATWKLMHTMTLRFPKKPSPDEREAIKNFFYLTSRLYPCGECAAEFQALLKKYPPQTSSRLAVSSWLCGVHNQVNERLKKPIFDCAHLEENYDCGCGDTHEDDEAGTTPATRPPVDDDLEDDLSKDEMTGLQLIKGG